MLLIAGVRIKQQDGVELVFLWPALPHAGLDRGDLFLLKIDAMAVSASTIFGACVDRLRFVQ